MTSATTRRAQGPAFWQAVGVVESFRPNCSAQSIAKMQEAVIAAGRSRRTAQAATAFVREFYDLGRWSNGAGPVIGPRKDEPEPPVPAPQFCTCGGKVLAYDRESPPGSRFSCLTCAKRPRKPIKATAVLIHSRRPGGVDPGDYGGPPRSVRASRSAGRADADLLREMRRAGLLGETSTFGPGYWH